MSALLYIYWHVPTLTDYEETAHDATIRLIHPHNPGNHGAPYYQPNAWTTVELNLRVGPGRNFDSITSLPMNTAVVLEARNSDTAWVLVHVVDSGVRGWAKTTLLKIAPGVSIYRLPISDAQIVPGAGNAVGTPPAPTPGPVPTVVLDRNLTAPILPQITTSMRYQARLIRQKGQQLGNNPAVFSKVGDCMTDYWAFLDPFGYGTYDLGKYGNLLGAIQRFSTPLRDGVPNSWSAKSAAAHNGFNSSAVLDPQWADPSICLKGESPLQCEYRLNKPGIAVIMFGTADVLVMTPREYNYYLREIVKETMDRGILPVLSTFPENLAVREKAKQINQVVLTIAKEKNIPVMNLQAALEGLPNNGIDSDGIHLTVPPEARTAFFSDENMKYGYTIRNLVTLQTLDIVWRELMR